MEQYEEEKRWEALKEVCPRGSMVEGDLRELYSYLDLFRKTYTCGKEEAEIVMGKVLYVYTLQFCPADPERAIREFGNPRNAGRKKMHTPEEAQVVQDMRKKGYSIREIARETRMAKSVVQRMLQG